MEDLKQIQEFFSKPLNEVSGNIDLEDFIKVYQAIAQSGHPATIMLSPMFGKNEIEIIVGMDAPDPIIDGIFNIMDNLGYKSGTDYSISGDSSTLSRRTYSDIRRVNGGHKDYWEESVNEAQFTDYSNNELATYCKNNPTDRKAAKELHKRSQALKGLTRTDEAKKDVKGDITDLLTGRYGWKFQLATGVGALIANLARHPEMIEKLLSMIGLNEIDEAKVEVDDKTEFKLDLKHLLDKHVIEATEEENEFHKKLDKLVHKTFGHSSDEKKKMTEDKSDAVRWFSNLKFSYQKALAELKGEDRETYKQLAKDFFSKLQIDDKVRAVGLEEAKIRKAHGQKISKELFAKLKGKVINYKGTEYKVVDSDEAVIKLTPVEPGGRGKTINLNQFNVGGIVYEVLETIKLGQQLNEELCEKGKAYIKKRQAAGEKSSAYLSGRAVRVCKGQMKG